ncbi:hypothetical protein [Aquipuribacter sp. SD81]|uniref:hypothetical protein n=1 Tax=Aquipuribacter sp. SD81 TaxID=3127703 RepID=UPI0030190FF8
MSADHPARPDVPPQRRRPPWTAVSVAAAAVVGLAAVGAAPAQARTDVERVQVPFGRFYDNLVTGGDGLDTDLLLFAGVTVEDVCRFSDIDEVALRTRTTGTPPEPGATQDVAVDDQVRLTLYDGDGLSVPELLDSVCPGVLFAGESVEPLASGEGLLRLRESATWVAGDDGPVRVGRETNSATGTVVTGSGERLVVRARSTVTFEPEPVVQETVVEVLNR